MAKSGVLNTSGYEGRYLQFSWMARDPNIANNQTIIDWTLKGAGEGEAGYYTTQNIKVKIDGVTVYDFPISEGQIRLWNGTEVASGSYTFTHEGDGSRSFSVYVEAGIYEWAVNCTGTKEFTLDTIARTSVPTVNASTVQMGSAVTINTNRMSTELTHTLKCSFGGTTGTIATDVGDSYEWTVPDMAAKISGKLQDECTITCITYSGSTQVGSSTVTITLQVPSASVPSVSPTSVQMGKRVKIDTNRKSSAFIHVITYKIGSKTGTISSNAWESILWTPPTDMAAFTGNKTIDTCMITCTTYNGDAPVGTNTVAIKLMVPSATIVTLNAESIEMGKSITIGTPRESTAYTHDLTYYIAGEDGSIATDVETGYEWSVPMTLAAKVPDKTSAEVTVICTTRFKGSTTVVGRSTATFTATVPNNKETQPKVKMSMACVSDLPSKFAGIYVAGKTKVKVTYEASSDCSTIDSYTTTFLGVAGYGNPYTSPLLSTSGEISITGTVEDKRGYNTTVTDSISVEPYSRPRILPGEGENSIICTRCDSNGKANVKGTWLLIKIGRKYSPVGDKNTCNLSYRHKKDTDADYSDPIELLAASASSDYVSVKLPDIVPSTTTAYTIQLIAEDDIGENNTVTVTIPTAFVTAHSPEGGHGLTVGGYHDPSKYDRFVCNFDAEFMGEVHGIYKSGETDGWSWRKYSDGIAECWRRVSQVVDITSGPKNYMYYGACQDVSFPFEFTAVPVCHTSVECNNILMIGSYGNASTEKPAKICVFKPEDANQEEDLTVVYHAIGRWK